MQIGRRVPCQKETAAAPVPAQHRAQCDACPHCDDTCTLRDCEPCEQKRIDIIKRMGPSKCKQFTLCQIRRHAAPEDCWLCTKDTVFDATQFAASGRHPGGQRSIYRRGGGDASADYAFHTKDGQAYDDDACAGVVDVLQAVAVHGHWQARQMREGKDQVPDLLVVSASSRYTSYCCCCRPRIESSEKLLSKSSFERLEKGRCEPHLVTQHGELAGLGVQLDQNQLLAGNGLRREQRAACKVISAVTLSNTHVLASAGLGMVARLAASSTAATAASTDATVTCAELSLKLENLAARRDEIKARKRMATTLLALEVLGGETDAAHQLAHGRLDRHLGLDALGFQREAGMH